VSLCSCVTSISRWKNVNHQAGPRTVFVHGLRTLTLQTCSFVFDLVFNCGSATYTTALHCWVLLYPSVRTANERIHLKTTACVQGRLAAATV